MWYFSAPDWILSYRMNAISKFVLLRALNLSRKDPTTPRFLTNESLAMMFGVSKRTIVNAFKELKAEGFITLCRNPNNPFDNSRFFILTEKALRGDDDTQPIDFSQSEKIALSNKQKLHIAEANIALSQSENIALSSSKNIDKRKNKRERALCSYTTECDKDIQQSCISEIQQSSSSSIYENEYRERIEREHTLCSIISLSGLIKLFNDTAKVMSKEHPLAQTLNLKHVAEKFYTVKASATFETDKALTSAVTKWLLNEIEYEMNSGKKSSASNQVDAFTAMERFSQFINSRNEKSITTGTDYALKSITKKE